MGATNDARRCDPAIVRAGRFNRIIKIGLPEPDDLEKMLRVRLGRDLAGSDLRSVARLAMGSTGADIEKVVKDARRAARHANRALTLADLRTAIVGDYEMSREMQRRIAIHEASHILVDVVHHGGDDIVATLTPSGARAGASFRYGMAQGEGTYADLAKRLDVLLAGRAGEVLVLGEACTGSGGQRGSDLESAVSMAAAMVGSLGVAGRNPLLYLGAAADTTRLMSFESVRLDVSIELSKALARSTHILRRHRRAIDLIAEALLRDGRIEGSEVARIAGAEAVGRSFDSVSPYRAKRGG